MSHDLHRNRIHDEVPRYAPLRTGTVDVGTPQSVLIQAVNAATTQPS